MKKPIILTICLAFLFSTPALAQNAEDETSDTRTIQLEGTHSISLHAGFQGFESNVGYTSGVISSSTNLIGSISYRYWNTEKSAFSFSVGVLKFENFVSFSRTYTISTVPVVMGYDFYPDKLRWGKTARGYFGMNAGVYLETNSGAFFDTGSVGAGTRTEAKPGADLHFGVDFFPSEFIRLGPQVALHSSEYFNGGAFSLTIGVLL